MVPSSTEQAAVVEGIARCASALENLVALRTEVHRLRSQPGDAALFAAALFDLERARRGDAEARTQMLEVADSLLVFWRDRSGDGLADSNPVLAPLWASASALLASFEVKRFKRALDGCWEARADAALLQVAIEALKPVGNRRVEFAACLYHLELARLFVDSSRGEFARRAGLIHEAYHSKEVAEELVGDDPGLQHLWKDLVPYLDEFFEALEEESERKTRSNVVTSPGGGAAVRAPVPPPPDITPVYGIPKAQQPPPDADLTPAGGLAAVEAAPLSDATVVARMPEAPPGDATIVARLTPAGPDATPIAGVEAVDAAPVERTVIAAMPQAPTPGETTDPVAARPIPVPRPSAPDAPGNASGVFELWLKEPERATRPPRATPMSMEAIDVDLSTAPRPAHKPKDLTPAPQVLDAADVEFVPVEHTFIGRPPPPPANLTPRPSAPLLDVTEPGVRVVRPPPPPDLTPPPSQRQKVESGVLDLAEVVEEPAASAPPPPPNNDSGILELADLVVEPAVAKKPLRPSLDVDVGDYDPDEAAQAFWRHTEAGLGLLPPADAPRMDRRALSAEGRAERKKLNGWLDGVTQRFDTVPEARTFACLVRLYMAAQLKEKGLFGGVNAKRREAFVAALELLSPEPLAAGHCAVWFELDGKETTEHLQNGLEVLTDYLQFCARQNLDPLDPLVPAQFLP